MSEPARVQPVRVVVVDDLEDIRFLLRVQLAKDPRFEVVGEASNGHEAIAVADAERPDLMILDRQMPELGGLEAMPEIRRRSPDTAIVLYTAQADAGAYQAAMDAGALHVLDKMAGARGFVDLLVGVLVESASAANATVEVRVGPVSSNAARVWVANTTKIIEAIAANPHVLGAPIPDDVLDLFRSFLAQWGSLAESTEEFRWVARASSDDVQRIVGYWAAIDVMTDAQLEELGVHWSPPEGHPFFVALTEGVVAALERNEETKRLAARLSDQFASYEPPIS